MSRPLQGQTPGQGRTRFAERDELTKAFGSTTGAMGTAPQTVVMNTGGTGTAFDPTALFLRLNAQDALLAAQAAQLTAMAAQIALLTGYVNALLGEGTLITPLVLAWANTGAILPFVDGINIVEADTSAVPAGQFLLLVLPPLVNSPRTQVFVKVTGDPAKVRVQGAAEGDF